MPTRWSNEAKGGRDTFTLRLRIRRGKFKRDTLASAQANSTRLQRLPISDETQVFSIP